MKLKVGGGANDIKPSKQSNKKTHTMKIKLPTNIKKIKENKRK